MAVYTTLSAAELAALIAQYDVGELVSAKGIAEGVSNSNWLIETTGNSGQGERFILTMYEARVDADDLPFFLGLLDHLAAKGSPVPRTIHDRDGAASRLVRGKAVALIEFLPGVSVDDPSAEQARAVGEALAGIHIASADFSGQRANGMSLPQWHKLFADCGEEGLRSIDPELPNLVRRELDFLSANWPKDLPHSVIHADLFPDNVLLLGEQVCGLIDFYFACTDITAYDLAVTHSAWCFSKDGRFRPDIAEALVAGYAARRTLSAAEWNALPLLARGAALRFVATRAYDWLNTPADALVTRKDPMDFARRLSFYAAEGERAFPRVTA
ncbi:homoserine kinase [Altererythrobacter sp. Root672]|uniref:homoserine kinase n=1 Tax=Altererythrobacter sp. Root672 TaxID=1736584 RepID=UPI0006FDA3B0|nr:homoserine kinase [Altererythrobacter sp. Root672]KRA84307.1 homoserine kinase [Altererythrobacter sp. Root672]